MLNNIKSFGLNVIPENTRTVEQTAQSVESAISSMWEPILGYLKENDNVFSGQVQEEINKISSQAMKFSMIVGTGKPRTSIDYES